MDTQILSKVQRLLALSKSSNEHEAAAALAQAQRLMARHKLTQAMIEVTSDEPEAPAEPVHRKHEPLHKSTKKVTWKGRLAASLARANGAYMYYRGGDIVLVGRDSDVATVRYLFTWCVRQVDRITREECEGESRSYRNSFRHGVVRTISDRLHREAAEARQEARAAAPTGSSLVVVDKALAKVDARAAESVDWAKRNLNISAGRRASISDGGAYSHGRDAGHRVSTGGSGPGLPAGSKSSGRLR